MSENVNIPKDLAERLGRGEIGVMPTDTIYGVVASALNETAVERVYQVRQRDLRKPSIVLVAEPRDCLRFGVPEMKLDEARHYWPGPVSVAMPVEEVQWDYLHRGKGSIAFREPSPQWLRDFLRVSGPLIAPSANLEGQPPAKTVEEAKQYFGESVDFYVDGGRLSGEPSKLISIVGPRAEHLR